MAFLPVADRELRVAARRGRTYWGRFGIALGAMVVGAYAWGQMEVWGAPANRVGSWLFNALASTAFVYCLAVGAFVADSISGEKREGTLGFLFLTDLKGYDVVAGKLAASLVPALFGLLAVVPVLAIAVMLGGVSGELLGRVVLVLFSVMVLSQASGLLVSAMSRNSRNAASGFVLLVLLLTIGLPVLGTIDAEVIRRVSSDECRPIFFLPSPIFAMMNVFGAGVPWSGPPRDPYWWSIASLQAMTLGFLGIAAFLAPKVWQEKGVGGPRRPWERARHWLVYGNAPTRQERRRRLLNRNPICWLSSRERWQRPAAWILLGVVGAGWLLGFIKLGRDWMHFGVGLWFALSIHAIFKYWLTTEASKRLAEDRQSGALELVLSTSLTVRAFLEGHWLAMRRMFLGPWAAMLVIDALLLWAGLRNQATGYSSQGEFSTNLLLTFLAGMLVLVVHFFALGWVGMWRGLSMKSWNRAMSLTVTQVMILPWLIFLFLNLGFGIAGLVWSWGWSPPYYHYLGLWLAVMVSLNLGSLFWARRSLLRRFRQLATERFDAGARRGWFGGRKR